MSSAEAGTGRVTLSRRSVVRGLSLLLAAAPALAACGNGGIRPLYGATASGAGIGLYVSRGLITAMGGRIWVKPREGGGSEFGFTLPRYQEDAVPVGSMAGRGVGV